VSLLATSEEGAGVAVKRQDLRVILHRALSAMVAVSQAGTDLAVTVRIVRGAVLVRLTQTSPEGEEVDSAALSSHPDYRAAGALVGEVNGTLLCDTRPERLVISMRLPRAPEDTSAAVPCKDAA
jgi:hypothetical protein